jgi:hypothetical protein
MRSIFAFVALALLAAIPSVPAAHAQDAAPLAAGKTFRADLYFVGGTPAPGGLKVEHLREAPADLGVWVKGSNPEKLQSVTVAPGQDNAVVKYHDLTFRISGLYRGPQKDRMFLRVSFDEGGQAAVKEFLAGLEETVIVTYPRVGGAGSLLVLLVPTG